MEEKICTGKLANKVAIITGGASGIGAAAVRRFAVEGASLAIADIDSAGGQRMAEELCTKGSKAIFVRTDISSREDILNLLEQTRQTYGGIDIILPNAGWQGPLGTAVEYDPDAWNRVVDIDLHGAYYLCRYGLPYLRRRGGGSIVITASLSAYDAAGCVPAYAAAKAALAGMAQSLAYDFGREQIRVNSVCPASVNTKLLEGIMSEMDLSPEEAAAHAQRRLLQYPMGRLGEADDIAKVMVFLASDDSSYVTGKNIIIDGGYWAGVPHF